MDNVFNANIKYNGNTMECKLTNSNLNFNGFAYLDTSNNISNIEFNFNITLDPNNVKNAISFTYDFTKSNITLMFFNNLGYKIDGNTVKYKSPVIDKGAGEGTFL